MAGSPCSVAGCDGKAHARGWCPKHYQAWRAHGNPLAGVPRRKRGTAPPACAEDGCERPVDARGWCDKHYRRWLHNGGPAAFAPRPDPSPAQLAALAVGRAERILRAQASVLSDEERRERHRVASREYARRQRALNPDEARRVRREQMARYDADYRRRWNTYNRHRRKAVQVQDAETADEYARLLAGDPCCYCGAPMEHLDHIVPLVRGGSGEWDNLTSACADCNKRKGSRDLLRFLEARRLEVAS